MITSSTSIIFISALLCILFGIVIELLKIIIKSYKSNKLEITIERGSGKPITLEVTEDMEQDKIDKMILEALASQ